MERACDCSERRFLLDAISRAQAVSDDRLKKLIKVCPDLSIRDVFWWSLSGQVHMQEADAWWTRKREMETRTQTAMNRAQRRANRGSRSERRVR